MSGSGSMIVCIVCSVFKLEVQALVDRGDLDLPLRFLDSDLHMRPADLKAKIEPLVESELARGNGVILVYGDCHAHMNDLESRPGVARTRGLNCCEILLGREAYRSVRKNGAFVLMPEWISRWRELFEAQLGLSSENATGLMGDMHDKVLYPDMKLAPIPAEELQAFSDYCGLPWEVVEVSLDHLLRSIREAMNRLHSVEV